LKAIFAALFEATNKIEMKRKEIKMEVSNEAHDYAVHKRILLSITVAISEILTLTRRTIEFFKIFVCNFILYKRKFLVMGSQSASFLAIAIIESDQF